MLNIGQFEISRVIESEGPFLPVQDFIPEAEQAVIEANRDWLYPRYIEPGTDKIMLNIQSYILRTPRHTILVDTCVGNDKPRPGRPMFDQLNLPYLADLAAAGVQPEEVDFVLCTHLHVDHVGWNTKLIDGRWVPTFPNAKYIFARKEYEFWEQRHLAGTEGPVPNVYDDSVLPVMEAGQAVVQCVARRSHTDAFAIARQVRCRKVGDGLHLGRAVHDVEWHAWRNGLERGHVVGANRCTGSRDAAK